MGREERKGTKEERWEEVTQSHGWTGKHLGRGATEEVPLLCGLSLSIKWFHCFLFLSHPHYVVNFGNISYTHIHKCSVWVAFWCKLKKELSLPSGLMWSRLRQGAQEGKISYKLSYAGEADVPGVPLRDWAPWELTDNLGRGGLPWNIPRSGEAILSRSVLLKL